MTQSPGQIIEAICPELYSSPSLQIYLDMASPLTDRGFFGKSYNMALAYRAAHLFVLHGDNGGVVDRTAQIASKTEKGLSISYAVGGQGNNELMATVYGRVLLSIIKTKPRMGVNTKGGYV